MASRLNPSWWHGDASLDDTIAEAMNLPLHRERWKYTRPQKAFDLVTPDSGTASEIGTVDIDAQLKTAPDALFPFIQGYNLTSVDAGTSQLDLSNQINPVHVEVAANSHMEIHRHEVSGFGNFVWLNIGTNGSAEVSLNALTETPFWDSLHIYLKRDARLVLNIHNLGASLARQDVQIHCEEPGADVTINAAASVTKGAHLDQQVTLHHKAPNTSSRQQFHTAAAAKSQVTFNGRIHIYEQCPGVDAHLSNKNLALSESATINTKPELEIYTDDVACSHGATVGALDEAELFYCVSRGISPELAQRMLGLGFLKTASNGPLAEPAQGAFEGVLA